MKPKGIRNHRMKKKVITNMHNPNTTCIVAANLLNFMRARMAEISRRIHHVTVCPYS
jgi:hypothetical protein